MILAGIDEAGYGPLLGPLVVGLAAFEAGSASDLWETLGDAVGRRPAGDRDGRLVVVDSKELYRGGAGLADLETAALAFSSLATGVDSPATAREFLARHLPAAAPPTDRYPWYREGLDRLELPVAADRDRLERAVSRLRAAVRSAGVTPARLSVRPLLAAEFNREAARLDSKARVLFDLNVELIQDLRARAPDRLRVLCDRHGGRRHYSTLIESAFPMTGVRRIAEERQRSSYQVGGEAAGFELTWVVNGERHGLEVALASILAKYTRELFMELLNRHFAARVPGLRRTAGYWLDGQRFVRDLEGSRAITPAERELLVRTR